MQPRSSLRNSRVLQLVCLSARIMCIRMRRYTTFATDSNDRSRRRCCLRSHPACGIRLVELLQPEELISLVGRYVSCATYIGPPAANTAGGVCTRGSNCGSKASPKALLTRDKSLEMPLRWPMPKLIVGCTNTSSADCPATMPRWKLFVTIATKSEVEVERLYPRRRCSSERGRDGLWTKRP